MSAYEPGQTQQPYTPPPPGYVSVPTDAKPFGDADRMALIALAVSLTVLLSCVPGLNCLAFIAPLGVGIYTLSQAKNAVDPSRARTYGWVATGIGIVIVVGFLVIVAAYGVMFASMMNQMQEQLR